jgi:hypothetical protein
MAYQTQTLDLFPNEVKVEQDYTATFADNMKMPIHKCIDTPLGFQQLGLTNLFEKK